jgi:hypothetical protein
MIFERPEFPSPPSGVHAARSLATGVLELCALCETLLNLAAVHDVAPNELTLLSERLEAVRDVAAPLALVPTPEPAHDPYALSLLGQWVWRE